MSSIISHIYMGNILKQKYNLNDEFLYGSIMPDVLTRTIDGQNKVITHYLRHGILYGSEGDYPDIERFLNENKYILPNSKMMQGYVSHLIEDMLWFSVYIPSIATKKDGKIIFNKDNSIHTDSEFKSAIYSDYPLIDRYLLKKSNLNILNLREEFLRFTDDEKLKDSIKDNFKLFDIQEKELILLSIDKFEEYMERAINKVSLVLDQIYK